MRLKLKRHKGQLRWYYREKGSQRFKPLDRLNRRRYDHMYRYCDELMEVLSECFLCHLFKNRDQQYGCLAPGLHLDPKKLLPPMFPQEEHDKQNSDMYYYQHHNDPDSEGPLQRYWWFKR